jgi:hypothetical protein
MRIYTAGASAQIDVIEDYNVRLRAAGHTISFDWTEKVRAVGSASPDDPAIRKEAALADLGGVETSEIMWLLQPENASTGAWVELGFALCLKQMEPLRTKATRPLVIVSGPSMKCIFSDLADHRFTNHEDAFTFITSIRAPADLGAST